MKQYIALEDVDKPQAEVISDTVIYMRYIDKAMKNFRKFDNEHGYPTVADCQEILMDTIKEMEQGE